MIKKYFQSILLFFAVALIISLVSCDPSKKFQKAESESIQNYLNTHSTDTFQLEPSGLYYRDVLVGTGRQAVVHDTAYVTYTSKFLDGTVFDSNVGKTILIFPVYEGTKIIGFDEGITYMKEGGKAQFLLPSSLAYGTMGWYLVPGYTPLLFDVDLVKLIPGPGK